MISDFHLLRPWWLLVLFPLIGLVIYVYRQKPQSAAWSAVCDPHLLAKLLVHKGKYKRNYSLIIVSLSALCMILAASGPAWIKLPAPVFRPVAPKVLVLDMSQAMLENDLAPDRLTRAKFKLHDLLQRKDKGQFGLVVYTGEPYVVSPMTEDADTVDALLPMLTQDIMPVGGSNLSDALKESAKLITDAGFSRGEMLVLSATPPDELSIETARRLAQQGMTTSVMPITRGSPATIFKQLASAGDGYYIPYSDAANVFESWLAKTQSLSGSLKKLDEGVPLWRDEGRWLLIPALLLLLPVFRRGWLERIGS